MSGLMESPSVSPRNGDRDVASDIALIVDRVSQEVFPAVLPSEQNGMAEDLASQALAWVQKVEATEIPSKVKHLQSMQARAWAAAGWSAASADLPEVRQWMEELAGTKLKSACALSAKGALGLEPIEADAPQEPDDAEGQKVRNAYNGSFGLSICLSVCLSLSLSFSLSLSHSLSLSLTLSLSLFVCLSVCLPACLSVCLPACLSVCLSFCLSVRSVCMSVCLYVFLSVCLSVCLSIGRSVGLSANK